MSDFIHLHAHSTYSFMDGFGTEEQIAERINTLGHTRVAITDHGTMFGHVPYHRVMPKHGIYPIYGCEMYVVDDISVRTRYQESLGVNAIPHVTIFALTQEGYSNLIKLSELSWHEGFYYKPRIDWAALAKYQKGLVVLSGCGGGYPSRLLIADPTTDPELFTEFTTRHELDSKTKGKKLELPKYVTPASYKRALDFCRERRNEIEHYYIEVVPEPGFDVSHLVTDPLFNISRDLGIPAVITSDAHFPREEDYVYQDVLLCSGMNTRLQSEDRLRLPNYQYYDDRATLTNRARKVVTTTPIEAIEQALNNTLLLGNHVDVSIPKGKTVSFYGVTAEKPSNVLLWDHVTEGLKTRFNAGKIPSDRFQEYSDRACVEFEVIQRKNFCDYLLAVSDVISWVKQQGGLVMVRGSAGGCLLLWLTGASETDPILHDLSFDRFFDEDRDDPPDVDIDFEESWRARAIDYMFERYGHENCAQVAALSKLTAKAALQATARALGLERSVFDKLSRALDSKGGDVEEQYTAFKDKTVLDVFQNYPELRLYEGIIGQYKTTSIHAAGVLVSSQPISDVISTILSRDKIPVAAVDKYGAAEIGLLKMDFLVVKSLDVLGQAARKARGSSEWLYHIPLNDQKAIELAKQGALADIFQLDGASAMRVIKEIHADSFDDLVAASALCRPGPADAGAVDIYRDLKINEISRESYLRSMHPVARSIVEKTYGLILYQEQVMKFARLVAGFVKSDMHKLRKGVSGSMGDEWMNQWAGKFVDGATKTVGMSLDEAKFWWNSIATHGSYSFNKSHCVTYGLISYWGLVLKAHHPMEFYEAAMNYASGPTQKRLCTEFRRLGGKVKLFDELKPSNRFEVKNGVMTGPLNMLAGIGPINNQKIVDKSPFKTPEEFYAAVPSRARRQLQQVIESDWDPCLLLPIVKWFPVLKMARADAEYREYGDFVPLKDFPSFGQGTFFVCGYVAVKELDEHKAGVILEDETGTLTVRVSKGKMTQLSADVAKLKVGDFISVLGWWSGEILYVQEVQLVRRADLS